MNLRIAILVALPAIASAQQPPPTPKKPIADAYHGVSVVDDYRWLENYSDPAVRAWSASQNRYARHILDALPMRATVLEELKKLYSAPSPSYYGLISRPGALFAMKNQPPKEQPLLVVLKSAEDRDSERVILDPNSLDPSGGTAVDFFVPSLDGKYVAVSLSKGRSESGDVPVYEVSTRLDTRTP